MKNNGGLESSIFATTALVAFAGAAAAQSTISGDANRSGDIRINGFAEMGIAGGDTINRVTGVVTGFSTQFWQDIEVEFSMSGSTDNGLNFGAVIELDEAVGPATDDNGARVFISGSFGTLTMGDTDGAFDWAVRETGQDAAGSIDDIHTSHAGYNGNNGFDGLFDGQILRYDYTVGSFGVAVSTELDDTNVGGADPILALGFRYGVELTGVNVNLGLGYTQVGNGRGADAEVIGLSAVVGASGVNFIANYSEMSSNISPFNVTHWGVGVEYASGPLSVAANYGIFEDGVIGTYAGGNPVFSRGHEASGYGLSAAYALGGGLSIQGAYSQSDVRTAAGRTTDTSEWSLGLRMNF